MTHAALAFAQNNADRFIDQLKDLLRIPSVSTRTEHAADVERAAEWLIADMERIGLDVAEVHREDGFLPIVYGEYHGAGPDASTALIYCHYDVQPAEMADGWTRNPFEPVEDDGRLFARGALDSKGHVVAHLKAVESLLATGGCPVNVKLLFEGEEESGSEHIFRFVAQNPDKLKTDIVAISDGSMPAEDQPIIAFGLRGMVTMEVEIQGPQTDLHSGHYGGTVHNPIQALAEILAALHDENGRVTVPGFYDAVVPLDDKQRDLMAKALPWTEREWHAVANAPQPWGEPDYTLNERIGARPTLEINGIRGGYAGEGFKTVLPSMALAKVSCRLVPDQDPAVVLDLVTKHIESLAPPSVTVTVRGLEADAPGVLMPPDTDAIQATVAAYEKGWGTSPLLTREGGSVPVAIAFQQSLDAQMTLLSFGYKGGRAHGPDEYLPLASFHKGVATAIHFYNEIAARHG